MNLCRFRRMPPIPLKIPVSIKLHQVFLRNNFHLHKLIYFVEDVGCTLKSKCRPTRNDNLQGEIFTSKSSGKILKAKAKSTTNIA